jgi:hypothetical protein
MSAPVGSKPSIQLENGVAPVEKGRPAKPANEGDWEALVPGMG